MLLGILGSAVGGLALFGVGSPQEGQAPPSTPSEIEQVLKATGYEHKDEGGFISFKLTFTDTKRKHTIFVRKAAEQYLSLKVNEVYGLAYESTAAPQADLFNKIFEKRFSLGHVIVEKPSERQKFWRIRYRLDFHSGWTPDRFKEIAAVVGGTADALEQEFNPGTEDTL